MNKILDKALPTLFFLISFIFSGYAQSTDFRIRLTSEIKKEFRKDLSASIKYEHRFDQNISTFDKAFIEPVINYNPTEAIRIGARYRFMYDQNKVREQTTKQRIAIHMSYSHKMDDFKFKIKTMLQYGFDDLSNVSIGNDQKLVNRYSIKVEYDWFGTQLNPFAEFEIFYHINNSNGGIVNQNRITAGSEYTINKTSTLQVYYLFDNEFHVVSPVDAHVVGMGYSYRF